MRVVSLSVLILCCASPAYAQGEEAGAPLADPALSRQAVAQPAALSPDFRDISGYRFPAVAQTARDMQMLAYAMQLREFCANQRVSDEFVRDRLLRFSGMTGREEDCASLLDY